MSSSTRKDNAVPHTNLDQISSSERRRVLYRPLVHRNRLATRMRSTLSMMFASRPSRIEKLDDRFERFAKPGIHGANE